MDISSFRRSHEANREEEEEREKKQHIHAVDAPPGSS
jgi:hypothetical protein